jgi:hypothetical protein
MKGIYRKTIKKMHISDEKEQEIKPRGAPS